MPTQTPRTREQITRDMDRLRAELAELDASEDCPGDHQQTMEYERPDGTTGTYRGREVCWQLEAMGLHREPAPAH